MRKLGGIGTLFMGISIGLLVALILTRVFTKKDTDSLSQILRIIEQDYVDSIDMEKIRNQAIPTILESLDPHSSYLTQEELANDLQRLDGGFDGIGIVFNTILDTAIVERVQPWGPSAKAGVLPGDRILSVNEVSLLGDTITSDFIRSQLKGKRHSWAHLNVLRNGKRVRIDVKRDQVPVNSIDIAYMCTPKIGIIRLSTWSKTSFQEFKQSVQKLQKEGAQSFVIDLRDNMGGYMDQAIMIANEFLPKGQLIVYSEGRNFPRDEFFSDGNGSLLKSKFVILVNELSASASEIFAGAMQDHDRATIIGRRTFGKGLIQRPYDLPDGSCLRLTVGRYFTPSGRSIQKRYSLGDKRAYQEDLFDRYESGETFSSEQSTAPNPKKYYTDKGRVVYSEYGIMPDLIVPENNITINAYYSRLVAAEVMPRFAFLYIDRNRKALSKISSVEELQNYFKGRSYIVEELARYADLEGGVDQRPAMLREVRSVVFKQLVGLVAFSLFGQEGFYRVVQDDNPAILSAIEHLENL